MTRLTPKEKAKMLLESNIAKGRMSLSNENAEEIVEKLCEKYGEEKAHKIVVAALVRPTTFREQLGVTVDGRLTSARLLDSIVRNIDDIDPATLDAALQQDGSRSGGRQGGRQQGDQQPPAPQPEVLSRRSDYRDVDHMAFPNSSERINQDYSAGTDTYDRWLRDRYNINVNHNFVRFPNDPREYHEAFEHYYNSEFNNQDAQVNLSELRTRFNYITDDDIRAVFGADGLTRSLNNSGALVSREDALAVIEQSVARQYGSYLSMREILIRTGGNNNNRYVDPHQPVLRPGNSR